MLYIAQGIKYTFNSSDAGLCTDHPYKYISNNITLGEYQGLGSKFKLLYIDLKDSIESYPHQLHEGGIRPPIIKHIGFYHLTYINDEIITLSVQWDNQYYKCELLFNRDYFYINADFETPDFSNATCNPDPSSQQLQCPDLRPDFWISIYNPAIQDGTRLIEIMCLYVIDETGTEYDMWDFCIEPNLVLHETYLQNAVNCTKPSFQSRINVHDSGIWTLPIDHGKLVVAHAPAQLFNYPNPKLNFSIEYGKHISEWSYNASLEILTENGM